MATVTLKGNPIHTAGNLPKIGITAPDFELAKLDLSNVTLNNYKGQKVILNIFHSVDTGTCANSVRQFNKEASALEGKGRDTMDEPRSRSPARSTRRLRTWCWSPRAVEPVGRRVVRLCEWRIVNVWFMNIIII